MFRHPAVIRITHRVNALCLLVLLMSGLQIFNAHPALYWGKVSTFDTPIMAMSSTEDDPKGITTVLGRIFDTTSYLPVSCRMSFEAVILLTARLRHAGSSAHAGPDIRHCARPGHSEGPADVP